MCGISIAIDKRNQPVPLELITKMNDKIVHRGPDDEGYYHGGNFALGHRRLSILDLSAAGHQPMQWKHLWITYNGEVYNYVELRDELKTLGHNFKTGTDTEVILAAYEQWGNDAFARFNGMWSFAIYDGLNNKLVLCRDHFGIKPLYYTHTPQYFLAASEIKQFTVVPGFKSRLNKAAAVNYLVHGLLNYSQETFFLGVKELRPGHYLEYDLSNHSTKLVQWYDINQASSLVADSFETAVDKVRHLFSESVRIRMRSDVRVGSCLSGGIDSSSIVSMIHSRHLANGSFATITSCYNDKRYDEQEFSDAITDHTKYPALKVFPNLNDLWNLGDFDKMLYHQDQPIISASHYSEFKVFETARANGIIVMQDGQGSDEYLCGYGEFYIARVKEMIRSLDIRGAVKLMREKAAHRQHSFETEVRNFINSALGSPLQHRIKKIIGKSDFPWLSQRWRRLASENQVNFTRSNIRDLSVAEIVYSSIPYQLHSEDRNSMLFSIESRLPFLDPRLVEYCLSLPSSYKIRNGYTKAVLREAVSELPEKISRRKDKMGFVAPDVSWIVENKEQVRADLRDLVDTTGIFSDELLNRFDRFIGGSLGYESIYFRAMAFKRFCRIFQLDTH